MMPGRMPAMNSLPIEALVTSEYRMKEMLGGMRMPRLPATATEPAAIFRV